MRFSVGAVAFQEWGGGYSQAPCFRVHLRSLTSLTSEACLQVLSRSSVATALALEILRLKAPVPSVFRKAARDTTVQGIEVPKGTSVMISMRVVRMTHMHTAQSPTQAGIPGSCPCEHTENFRILCGCPLIGRRRMPRRSQLSGTACVHNGPSTRCG